MDPELILIIAPFFWPKLPPLGLAYLSSFLTAKGISHRVIDLNLEVFCQASVEFKKSWQRIDRPQEEKLFKEIFPKIKGAIDSLIQSKAKSIGFSVFNNNLFFSLKLAGYIKEKAADKVIVFGGPEVFYLNQDNFLSIPPKYRDSIDYYVIGEGEQSLYNLITAHFKPCSKVIQGSETPDLDSLPYPRYEQFNLNKYERKQAVAILGSRGCVKRCSFCAECLLFSKYRTRSPENILAEIEYHLTRHKIQWFTFHDSLLNGNLLNLEQLCDCIIENKLPVKWEAQLAIRQDMDISLLKKIKKAGCFNLFIGLESGSDTILKSMKKGFDVKTAEIFFKLCKEAFLNFEISLIVGFPGEGEKEFQETLKFLSRNKRYIPKVAQVNPFILLPGSEVDVDYQTYKLKMNHRNYYRPEDINKVERLVSLLKEEGIKFTNAFINNLILGIANTD